MVHDGGAGGLQAVAAMQGMQTTSRVQPEQHGSCWTHVVSQPWLIIHVSNEAFAPLGARVKQALAGPAGVCHCRAAKPRGAWLLLGILVGGWGHICSRGRCVHGESRP